MSIYSVAQVEALSGIKAHTLRVWERRYSFLTPQRTTTNIRYYTDEQMRKLLNIGILIRNGYKISHIDAMPDEEINDVVTDILSQPIDDELNDQVQALTIAMLEMNEDMFNKIFQKQVNKAGLLNTMLYLIYPFMAHVGILWGTSKAMPAQEHFISCLVRQKLITAIDGISNSKEASKSIVLFLPAGEMHEIGLLLAYYIAKDLGWKVFYLGANVPYENIKDVVEISDCDLLLTISVVSSPGGIEKLINRVSEATSLPLLISGSMITDSYQAPTTQVIPISDPFELIRFLKAY
ncbi:MerR family transcriptional regulator [Reichenbachiella versicolor]|uniref:MerR family transcriptional regulator n=1 Tax=Reichenbachiella versicolor TaxID=1821036 RepID=UPI000D6E5E71|nr:MerR family transcriptional regulator [Reichenbachiella versicolor]